MKAIVAMGLNRTIGYKGNIPWRLPEDFKWFRKMTSDPVNGGIIIMGSTTFDSVGVLPNRFTYVLTQNNDKLSTAATEEFSYVNHSTLLDISKVEGDKMWICGGAKIYELLMPKCTEIYVTLLLKEYDGDVFMPEFESEFPNSELIKDTRDYWIVRYYR